MSKGLMAFALVAEEYEKTGDPLRGLKPLFAPLLAEGRGKPFDPERFSEDFTRAYGLQMSPFVAAALSERMHELDLLERRYDKNSGDTYHVRSFEWESESIAEAQVEGTIELFVEWAKNKSSEYKKDFTREQLEDAILIRLARPEFASMFVQQAEEKNSRLRKLMGVAGVDLSAKDEAFFDYLVAAFVLHASSNAPAVFDSISQISYGSLIADAVAGLAVPTLRGDAGKRLRLVLDAPLVLDLLDLNSSAQKQYAMGLLEIAREADLMLATFDHSLDEMRQTIQATLEASSRGEGYGPMAQRLRTEPGKRLSATIARDHLRERIAELGITILRADTYRESRYSKWFPEERIDAIRNAIGDLHEHLEARIRDAESVAAVARLKGDKGEAESLFESGTIFVTRNSVLAKRVNKVLSRGRSGPRPTFTIATDGQIAGVLWFVGGMQGVELSRRRLIANCSAAVLPKKELISRLASTLDGINADLRKEFEVLMADGRASLCVMRLTAGDMDLIDRDKSLELVDAMRRELSAPALERAEAAELKASEIAQQAEAKLGEADKSIEDARLQAIQAADEGGRKAQEFDLRLAQLTHDIELERRNKLSAIAEASSTNQGIVQDISDREKTYDKHRLDLARRLRVELLLLGAVVTLLAVRQDAPLWIRICAATASLLTVGFLARFGGWIISILADWHFRKEKGEIEALRRHAK